MPDLSLNPGTQQPLSGNTIASLWCLLPVTPIQAGPVTSYSCFPHPVAKSSLASADKRRNPFQEKDIRAFICSRAVENALDIESSSWYSFLSFHGLLSPEYTGARCVDTVANGMADGLTPHYGLLRMWKHWGLNFLHDCSVLRPTDLYHTFGRLLWTFICLLNPLYMWLRFQSMNTVRPLICTPPAVFATCQTTAALLVSCQIQEGVMFLF